MLRFPSVFGFIFLHHFDVYRKESIKLHWFYDSAVQYSNDQFDPYGEMYQDDQKNITAGKKMHHLNRADVS